MARESVFFDERTDTKRVRVLKVYDAAYARACFDDMSKDALAFLARSLDFGSKYELAEPVIDLEWEDVEEEAREDGNRLSFFVVTEEIEGQRRPLFVSPDWPSAEEFAKRSL